MKRTILASGVLMALLMVTGMVLAEDLSIDRYIELSIARLEMAKASWTTSQLPPSEEASAALFSSYGIEEVDFVAYAGGNREAIDAYLAAHPDLKLRIDTLSAEITAAIKE